MATSFAASGKTDETYTPEQVVIGASDVITIPATFILGANVAALTVLGKITASGKYVKSASGASDGSEVPVAIAVEDVASAAADKLGPIYIAGEFNVDALVWDASYSTDALKLAAFGNGPIVLKKLAWSAI